MVMALFKGMLHSDSQYLAVSGREAKYICLGYRTRLSRMHTLDPPFTISFSEEQPFSNTGTTSKKITKGPQINRMYLDQTHL
jgi:hypothetical protein